MRITITTAPGQALLLTVLILGFAALNFVLIGLATATQSGASATAFEQKATASAAATGCVEQAMERLGLSSSYAGNETLTVGTNSCTIRPIIVGSGTWTIETSAQVGNQITRYRTILTSRAPVNISSWTEIAGF